MSMYRVDRLPGGSYVRYPTTVENEAAGAIVNGAATGAAAVAGWLVGSSITGMRSLARNFQDRRMQAAAEAMETAATAEQFDRLVGLAKDFGSHYPGQLLGEFYLAVALNGTGRYDEAITVADRAIGLGLDETEARGLRLEAYEGKGSIPGLLEEWSALIHHQDSLVRNTALLARARVLESIGDFDQALDDANRSISGLPDHVAYHVRGHIYESKGELEKAIDDYSRALRIVPDQQEVLERRATAYDRLGRTEEAQADRAHAEWLESPARALGEARAFLDQLASEGVLLRLSASGNRIVFEGAPMKREHIPRYEQLSGDLLQVLGGAGHPPG